MFKIEVARLFADGTWDTVFKTIYGKHADVASAKAEVEVLRDFVCCDGSRELSHVVTVLVQDHEA